MSNQFKIFLLVALSFLSSFDLSANDTFFSIENKDNRVCKLANGVGKTADEWLITLKGLEYTKFRGHLFVGDLKNGKGCHFLPGVDDVHVCFHNGVQPTSNSLGVLKGDIDMRRELLKPGSTPEIPIYHDPKQYSQWKLKNTGGEPQTFFPSAWDQDKILDECASAFANPNKSIVMKPDGTYYTNMYHAQSESGVIIRWFEDSNGKILSAFPEF